MIGAIVILLLTIGLVLLAGATLGMLRLPDCFSRAHAAGMCDSLGAQVCFLALAIYNLEDAHGLADWLTSAKILLIALFLLVTSPTATHAIFRAAWHAGERPWRRQPSEEEPPLATEGVP